MTSLSVSHLQWFNNIHSLLRFQRIEKFAFGSWLFQNDKVFPLRINTQFKTPLAVFQDIP